jgi:peptide/nickel transport system substrate-binding protein
MGVSSTLVRRLSVITGVLFVGLMLGSPCVHGQTSDKYGGRLTYAEKESVNEFNPYQLQEPRPASDRLFTLIYGTLVSYDYVREEVVPGLATDWTVSPKGAPAAERITFELREGVRWHDGEPFTTEDVSFTYQYLVGVRAGSNKQALKRFASLVDSVETDTEASTVTFHLVRPTPEPAQRFSSLWIIPEHKFNDKYVPKRKGKSLGENPVGTGPYQFVERKLNGDIELTAFKGYWGTGPYIADTGMRRVLDPSTMAIQAIGGSIQLIIETPPDQIGRLEQSGRFTLKNYQSLSFNAFGYNNNDPILGRRKVRRALTRAVDRKSLLEQWHANKGTVIGGPLVPGHPYYNPDVQPREHNPEKARTLLSEAGCKDRDGNGIRETADGEELRFQLMTLKPKAAQSTRRQNVAQSYASQLKEVGVEIEVVTRVKSNYLNSIFQKKNFDIAWIKWEFDPSYDISSLFLSGNNVSGGDNVVSYSNQKVDKLIRSFREATDPAAKRNYMYSIQEIIHEDVPYTFLYTIENFAAISLGVISTRIDPYYFFSYYNNWYIDPAIR